ncbi:MAG TPA: TetR/AcrR family transcriptional regulator [Methyloceanibacter sp.]|jgi:AcrR family transcriptional regulator|nr:TetR/AcrR family transcriptional regulator [Methyloceanibacter sp.]
MAGDKAVAIGRPRSFCKEHALDRALEVFWRKGYEGTSISDLTAAMGINPPSLYAAFGNKEGLFYQALERYAETHESFIRDALALPTAREAVAALLRGSADALTDKKNPAGCLLVQGIAGAGEHAKCISDALCEQRKAIEKSIRERLKRAKIEGDLPKDADAAALARFVATVTQGMSVQAAAGASRSELRRVAETALRAFPG